VNATRYLERISYRGPLAPTAKTLRQLQVAHLMSVPFENLSIHACEPIVLDDELLFAKVVTRRRGGFCYELNGLFAWLLRSLGFRVTMLAAEVMNARGEWGLPFDHMVLLVALEDRWLVDVGFGDSFFEPLRFDLTPYEYADYAEICRYHQTSPHSHFTRGRICSRATREGRVTISGTRLIVTTDDWRQEWELRSEKDYVEALRDRFGILLPS
jgi:N-hydroxyarylamine O-acetyltransferase